MFETPLPELLHLCYSLPTSSITSDWLRLGDKKRQMSLEHPYGVSLSRPNLLPPPQSTCVLPSPIKRIKKNMKSYGVHIATELLCSNIYSYICIYAGAILAMGRGGRETTLWHVIKEVFWQKLVILCLKTNLTWWIKQSVVQNTAG